MRNLIFYIILFSTLTFSSEITAEIPLKSIEGKWVKTHIGKDGQSYSDPRWSLKMEFRKDNTFTCISNSITEVRLVNSKTGEGETRPHYRQHQLSGRFEVDNDELILNFHDKKLTVMESCGLWRFGAGKGSPLTVRFILNHNKLTLASQQGNHEFHFTRIEE